MPQLASPFPLARLRFGVIVAALAIAVAACSASIAESSPPAAATPASAGAPPASSPVVGSPGATSSAPAETPTASAGGSPASGPVALPGARFPGGLLIADEANGRLLIIGEAGRILWRFPAAGSQPAGQDFTADDAFIAPDGKTIVANDEAHQVIDRIDIATKKIVWQYGHYGLKGSRIGYLHTPDDSYPLANGDVVVADIMNCRILEITPSKQVTRTWGRSRVCVDRAPFTFGKPNGDTPLPDGGLLITEIRGSRVVRLAATGQVVFDIHVPVRYPSDAQLDADGNVVVADYSNPGQVVAVSPAGRLLWRYAPRSGPGRLDHPSLATPLADGTVSINDDFRHRIVVIDPRTMRIVWQYGHTDVPGTGPGYLNNPDGHQPLPAGTTL